MQKQFHYLDIDKDESAPFEEIDPELEARKRQRRDDHFLNSKFKIQSSKFLALN